MPPLGERTCCDGWRTPAAFIAVFFLPAIVLYNVGVLGYLIFSAVEWIRSLSCEDSFNWISFGVCSLISNTCELAVYGFFIIAAYPGCTDPAYPDHVAPPIVHAHYVFFWPCVLVIATSLVRIMDFVFESQRCDGEWDTLHLVLSSVAMGTLILRNVASYAFQIVLQTQTAPSLGRMKLLGAIIAADMLNNILRMLYRVALLISFVVIKGETTLQMNQIFALANIGLSFVYYYALVMFSYGKLRRPGDNHLVMRSHRSEIDGTDYAEPLAGDVERLDVPSYVRISPPPF